MKKTVLIDFDGVIHSYTSGWKGANVIPDAPVPGAIKFLQELVDDPELEPIIFTTRVLAHNCDGTPSEATPESVTRLINTYLICNGLRTEHPLEVTATKRAAVLQIDDRVYRFKGQFPSLDFIKTFKPWNKS